MARTSKAIPGTNSARLPKAPSNSPKVGTFPGRAPSSVRPRDMEGRFIPGGFGVVWDGLEAFMATPQRHKDAVNEQRKAAAEQMAADMLNYMQANAPWEDRTGMARGLLSSKVVHGDENTSTITVAHGVAYGIYLETWDGGSLAIIAPTIEEFMGKFPEYAGGK